MFVINQAKEEKKEITLHDATVRESFLHLGEPIPKPSI